MGRGAGNVREIVYRDSCRHLDEFGGGSAQAIARHIAEARRRTPEAR